MSLSEQQLLSVCFLIKSNLNHIRLLLDDEISADITGRLEMLNNTNERRHKNLVSQLCFGSKPEADL